MDGASQEPVRIGEPGVMWVGGLGVSKDYVNLPQLTAQRYRPDKFTQEGRMFNTGDLCQWLPNGELKPLGCVDDQVKIKGVRIELDGVQKACVVKAEGLEELWRFYSCDGPKVDERMLATAHSGQAFLRNDREVGPLLNWRRLVDSTTTRCLITP